MSWRPPAPSWGITDRITPEDVAAGFRCSNAATEEYFLRRAVAVDQADIARAYVLRADADDSPMVPRIFGYYTLSSTAVDHSASKKPRPAALVDIPTPAVLIARFGIHADMERAGIGPLLLGDALARAVFSSDTVAAAGIVVFAPDERALRFGERMNFVPLAESGWPRRMFLRMTLARRAFQAP